MEEGKHEIVKANLGPSSRRVIKRKKVTNLRLQALFIPKNILEE